ncbi:penicillin acylase family protein, partial [Gammaproteobacteria bacterium]|nr:penicillin acylase family protein [Gammaproteobacteria bacterium]
MIKKISSASLLFAILSMLLSSCSILEKNSTFEISNQYNVDINRDFWGVPYIKGQTDQDVAYGIGLVHAEDAYEDLVELMPLYRGQNAIYNGLDSI